MPTPLCNAWSPDLPLLILGASGRAAAQSAAKFCEQLHVIDLFGDRDTRSIATVHCVDNLGQAFEILDRLPIQHLLYTGGLDRRPDLLKEIQNRFILLGNQAEVVEAVASPELLAKFADEHEIHFPLTRLPGSSDHLGAWGKFSKTDEAPRNPARSVHLVPVPPSKSIYRKSRIAESNVLDGNGYQRWIEGNSYSAVCFSSEERCWVAGLTRQLIGDDKFGAPELTYCGSIRVTNLPSQVIREVERIADLSAKHFGIRGIFGIDFILDEIGSVWLIEINPRFPASAELFEFSISMIHTHLECLESAMPPEIDLRDLSPKAVPSGKAILFHNGKLPIVNQMDWSNWCCADIPSFRFLNPGSPIVTLFASKDNWESTYESLVLSADSLKRRLGLN